MHYNFVRWRRKSGLVFSIHASANLPMISLYTTVYGQQYRSVHHHIIIHCTNTTEDGGVLEVVASQLSPAQMEKRVL